MTLDEACTKFLAYCENEKKLSKKTLSAYTIDLRQFTNYLGEEKTNSDSNDVKKEPINEYIDFLYEKNKDKTIRRKVATLNALFAYLEWKDIIEISPFRRIKRVIEVKNTPPATITQKEINNLFKAAEKELRYFHGKETYSYRAILRDIASMKLLFATGARVSEICTLKKDDIDLSTGEVKLISPKGEERMVKISDKSAITALRAYADAFQEELSGWEYFFINKRGYILSEQSIRFLLVKYANLGGIGRHITPHMARHTHATNLLEKGRDIQDVQQQLGHSSITSTQTYTTEEQTYDKAIKAIAKKHPRRFF